MTILVAVRYDTSMLDNRDIYSIEDIAGELEISVARVYQLIRNNEIPAVKIAGRLRVPRKSWESWLDDKAQESLESLNELTPPTSG